MGQAYLQETTVLLQPSPGQGVFITVNPAYYFTGQVVNPRSFYPLIRFDPSSLHLQAALIDQTTPLVNYLFSFRTTPDKTSG